VRMVEKVDSRVEAAGFWVVVKIGGWTEVL
jgi:hypothetical protein